MLVFYILLRVFPTVKEIKKPWMKPHCVSFEPTTTHYKWRSQHSQWQFRLKHIPDGSQLQQLFEHLIAKPDDKDFSQGQVVQWLVLVRQFHYYFTLLPCSVWQLFWRHYILGLRRQHHSSGLQWKTFVIWTFKDNSCEYKFGLVCNADNCTCEIGLM